jgi:non-ribosomal peptide synthetase component E (peptide arylation enzyme)
MRGWKERFGIEVINVYGSNEGMGLISMEPDVEKRASYFPTEMSGLMGFQVKVVDEQGNELTKPGEMGELAGKGPFLFPCYYKRPDLTEKAFTKDGFFRSGDLFIIEGGNKLRSAGRVKDLIIRGGQNISPEDIEDTLNAHPKVMESAAVGMPDPRLGEKVCVYIVPKEGEPPTLEELISYMKEKEVAVFKLPQRMEIMNELPRTPVGKIWKRVLREDIVKKLQMEQSKDQR